MKGVLRPRGREAVVFAGRFQERPRRALRKGALAAGAALAVFATGCLGPTKAVRSAWLVESAARSAGQVAGECAFDAPAKMLSVFVRPPYDGENIAVLRADGTVALDPVNVFAAAPGRMFPGPAADELSAAKLFPRVFSQHSSVRSRYGVDVEVTRLALDCRVKGKRRAAVELSATLLDGRECIAVGFGRGESDAEAGDYSAAFSEAFSAATAAAFKGFREK